MGMAAAQRQKRAILSDKDMATRSLVETLNLFFSIFKEHLTTG